MSLKFQSYEEVRDQIESGDLKFGSCVDELAPALRAEITEANKQSDKIIEWQQKEIKRYEEEKAP